MRLAEWTEEVHWPGKGVCVNVAGHEVEAMMGFNKH